MFAVIDTSEVTRFAALWQTAPDITREELLRTITECDLLMQGEMMQKLPRGAGGLHGTGLVGSIFHEEHALADNVIGLTATNQIHAKYVEDGTRPHAVGAIGIQALTDWVEAKIGLQEDEAEGMAHAIAWKIRREGTEANPVWQQTYTRLLPAFHTKFEQAEQRIIVRLAGGHA